MRTTVTLSDAQTEYVDEIRAQNDALDSDAAAVRRCVDVAREYEERVNELERELESIRAERDDLRRQLSVANSREEDVGELVEYVQEERSLQRRREEREHMKETAGVFTRAKWWVTGMPDVEDVSEK